MNRYETACQQATSWVALVQELSNSPLALTELAEVTSLSEQYLAEFKALGPTPAEGEAELAHREAWQKLTRALNKQVRVLDEALGTTFVRLAKQYLARHRNAMTAKEAEIAKEALSGDDEIELDSAGNVPGRAEREASALRETFPLDMLDLLDVHWRVRRARLGRYPAGFSELEQLLSDMAEEVPHMIDANTILIELHRRRTWEDGYHPVLEVQASLLDAIDLAYQQGVARLAASAPKKVPSPVASGLKRLLVHREQAEDLTTIALRGVTKTAEV